jgi:hypothetical protein
VKPRAFVVAVESPVAVDLLDDQLGV